MPSRVPKTLFTFNSQEDVQEIATGCDADIGGTSTVHFELDESTKVYKPSEKDASSLVTKPTAKFWGEMKLGVRRDMQDKVRGGYAGFRSKARFSSLYSLLRYLKV